MVVQVSRRLPKEYDDEGYSQLFNQTFTNFPEDVGLNNGLSAPQPDFVGGLWMPEYGPFPVDERVGGAVLIRTAPIPWHYRIWRGKERTRKEHERGENAGRLRRSSSCLY